MARFTLPRDLYHGPKALEALKTLPGKRAMICVGGGSMKRFGFLDRAEAYLKEIPAGLDRCHRRWFPHRCRQGHVDQVRVS